VKKLLHNWSALVAVATLIHPSFMVPAFAQSASIVTAQPNLHAPVRQYAGGDVSLEKDPVIPYAQMIPLVKSKIKYVFVIFNENESFDHEYGTFPGVNGIYSDGANPRSAADTPGFTQTYTDVNGNSVTVQPFRIGPDQNATFADSTDHSHTGLAVKLDTVYGQPRMDGFALDEYSRFAGTQANPKAAAAQKEGTQYARLVMAHVDCDTIPFFWQYANRFTIFDNIFATEDTPSSPNAIAMIAGQSGETQWVKHGATATPNEPISGTINGATYTGTATPSGVPVVNDPQPYWGSAFDTTQYNREPTGPNENWTPANSNENLTFATVPLTLAGTGVVHLLQGDKNPTTNEADIKSDIPYIWQRTTTSVQWRWYQNGYDTEGNEPAARAGIQHENYVSHHNGPQYFGYIANNPSEQVNLKGEDDFFIDSINKKLPPDGGVIYIRGGYYNTLGQTPPIQNPNYPNTAGLTAAEINTINLAKGGDDDHPSYSDHQLSETMNARVINAIANNPEIWSQSAIILTYDESDGLYDHVPPRILSYGPDGLPLARGIRIPLILISPYARAGAVSHAEGDHNAVIETINAIFGLPALSSLPEEKAALAAGNSAAFNQWAQQYGPADFQQTFLGPRDTNSPITDSLLSGFSPKRLGGSVPPLPASYAAIKTTDLLSYPHYAGKGCSTLGITPTDANLTNTIPGAGTSEPFNTLPATLPAYN
jgi:phospholipase C